MFCHQWQACGCTVKPHFLHRLPSFLTLREERCCWGKKNNPVSHQWPICRLGGGYWLCTHHVMDTEPGPASLYWSPCSELLWTMIHLRGPRWPSTPPPLVSSICVLDKLSHSSGMIIFCCGINPGDYGYGNVDWSQHLCGVSSSGTVSL